MPLPLLFDAAPAGARPFPHWRDELARSRLRRDQRGHFATEIRRFLRYCEILALPVNWARARNYLVTIPLPVHRPRATRALRWYFRAARIAGPPPPPRPPTVDWWNAPPFGQELETDAGWADDATPVREETPQSRSA